MSEAITAAPPKLAREYETLFAIQPDLTDEAVDRLVERMKGIVNREGGKVIRVTHWGRKKTAYRVHRSTRAIYLHYLYLGTPGIVTEFERNLRLTEEVWKYQTVKLADDVDPGSRAEEQDVKLQGDAESAAAVVPQEDEEAADDESVSEE